MTPKIGLIIVHGFMNATIKNYGYDQWSLTVNVHSFIYEHRSCMINDHRYRYEHQSCMINDHRFRHEHWSSMIIDHEHNYSWSMIVAMKCYWSYMISVDQWVISWSLVKTPISPTLSATPSYCPHKIFSFFHWHKAFWTNKKMLVRRQRSLY